MRSGCLVLCLLIASSAFSAAFAVPVHHSELAKTHKRIDPGHWGTDFETSLSVHEWSQISRAPGHVMHDVHFALQPRNMDTIREIADAVSDPTSPRYGQHLNIEQIARIVQAPESEIMAVTRWLDAHKISHKISQTRHIVEAVAPVAAIEALLHCELHVFKNKEEPERAVVRKLGSMYLPLEVADVVSIVFNVADPPLSRKGRIHRKSHVGSTSKMPKGAAETFRSDSVPKMFPNQPSPAGGQIVSVQGNGFIAAFSYESSPTAPLQIFAYLRCLDGDYMSIQNPNCSTSNLFVSTSFELFITDPRNVFGAGSSFEYRNFITLSNIDTLCPIRPDIQNLRVCFLTIDVQVPSSMSVQFIANTAYQGAAVDQSSFVLLPAPLPATPQLLARLYNAPLQYNCLDNRTSFGIYSFNEVVLQDDLDAYGRWMGLTLGSMTFDNLPYEKCTACIRSEATLDVELMLGMVKGATMWHWNFDRDGFFYFLANALLNNLTGTPDVISVSYGSDESPSRKVAVTITNDLYAMLATTAKTVIVASGDNGVFGNGCRCNTFTDPAQCSLCCSREYSFPEWPATCPYVTVVGGTSAVVSGSTPFYQNPSATQNTNLHYHVHEIMAGAESGAGITSGGGYSSLFPAMPFMHKAIRGYLKQQSVLTNSSEAIIAQSSVMWPAFNKSGTLMRGYPDVSALAARIPIFDTQPLPSGKIMTGGTSASTPIFAAYVVMMNDLRLQAGLPKLGNMLPLIYMLGDKHPEVFNDVTVGYHGFAQPKNGGCSNPETGEPICDANQDCMISGMRQGLTAAPGWDAVTGFGSINFERMLRYVLPGSDAVSIASFVNNGAVASAAAIAAAASADAAAAIVSNVTAVASSASAAAASANAATAIASAAATAAAASADAAVAIVSNATAIASAAATAAAVSATALATTSSYEAKKDAEGSKSIAVAAIVLSCILLVSNIFLFWKVQKVTNDRGSSRKTVLAKFPDENDNLQQPLSN